jgi:hypothetical protein
MTQAFHPKDCPMPLSFFLDRYDISSTTAWRWSKKGLPVLRVGAKLFIRESDWVRFLETQAASQALARARKPHRSSFSFGEFPPKGTQ